MYIYIINGVLEAGDLAVNLAMAYLYICRSQYIQSQLTSITSPISFFSSPIIDALFDDGPNQGKSGEIS